MKEKNLGGLIAFVSTLMILCLLSGLAGMYSVEIYEYLNKDKDSVKEIETITEEEAMTLVNESYGINYLLNREKAAITNYSNYLDTVSNQTKLMHLYWYIKSDLSKEFTKLNVEEAALKLYNSKDRIKNEDLYDDENEIVMYFDKSIQEYKINEEYSKSLKEYNVKAYEQMVEFKRENDVYVLTTNKFFATVSGSVNIDSLEHVYDNYNDYDLQNENYIFDIETICKEYCKNYNKTTFPTEEFKQYFTDNYEEYKGKLIEYEYVFTKENGIIKLISYNIKQQEM